MASCSTTLPMAVSEAPIGAKTGISKTISIGYGLDLNGNYGVKEAAKNAGITGPIATADEKTTNYILFKKKELIVTGGAE